MKNDKMRRVRRDRDTVEIVGLGVMALGLWSVLRNVMYFIQSIPEFRADLAAAEHPTAAIVLALFLILVLSLDLALHFYIGASARAVARNAGKKWGYLIAAGILAAAQTIFFAISVAALFLPEVEIEEDTQIVTAVIELTSLVMLIDLIAASVRLKRARRAAEKEAA